ncbi:hypothetical protein ACLIBG_03845 [Virgibacillus sp. W0181]|uniref:hypothetical protein n=1 Tax=Virgibacillus sp. W0181 TaxID=3391581 RepID=UPI003F467057
MDELNQHRNGEQKQLQPVENANEINHTEVTGNHMYDQADIQRNGSRDEETAAELADNNYPLADSEEIEESDAGVNSAYGWIAAALSVISFFIMPIIFGGAGIVLGFMARRRNAEMLGNTAIIVGAISIALSLFILPFF